MLTESSQHLSLDLLNQRVGHQIDVIPLIKSHSKHLKQILVCSSCCNLRHCCTHTSCSRTSAIVCHISQRMWWLGLQCGSFRWPPSLITCSGWDRPSNLCILVRIWSRILCLCLHTWFCVFNFYSILCVLAFAQSLTVTKCGIGICFRQSIVEPLAFSDFTKGAQTSTVVGLNLKKITY